LILSVSMETMKQNRREYSVKLRDRVGGHDPWGTAFGAEVFGRLNVELLGIGEGTLVPLDYTGLERSDVSFQREAVVETLRKHRPRLLFIVVNLSDPDIRENLSLALERRGEWLLVRDSLDHPTVLGKKLTPDQAATLEKVCEAGELVSSDLGEDNVKASTASSRLSWLWKAGLIERVEGSAATGGREHRYYPIL
jgi:hypothetical protein